MRKITSVKAGFTLVELLTAATITTVILGAVALGSLALQRSFAGNKAYMKATADSARVIDYISQDLRNASSVSRLTGSVSTSFKVGNFNITDTDQLCIFVPDYYLSNIPDNSSGSSYKTSRFSRANIPAGRTYYPYDTIVKLDGITRIANYPGTLEVRYVKKPRSATDGTLCYFRMEYEGTNLRRTDEIAQRADSLTIRVVAVDPRVFQISSSFSSYWSGETYRQNSAQFSSVTLENHRTDLRTTTPVTTP
jgi:hypothetical protein